MRYGQGIVHEWSRINVSAVEQMEAPDPFSIGGRNWHHHFSGSQPFSGSTLFAIDRARPSTDCNKLLYST